MATAAKKMGLSRRKKCSMFACTLAGLLSGLNLTQFSGLLELPSFNESFPSLTPADRSTLSAALLLGAFLNTFFAGPLIDSQGRRFSLIICGTLFFIGAITISSATSKTHLTVGRFIAGSAYAISNIVSPAYLTEAAPSAQRAVYVNLYMLSLNVGIVSSEVANALGVHWIENWKLLAALPMIPSLLLLSITFFFFDNDADLTTVSTASKTAAPDTSSSALPVSTPTCADSFMLMRADKSSFRRLGVAAGLMGAHQLTGINGVLLFAPSLLFTLGIGNRTSISAPFWAAALVGLTNACASFFALYAVDLCSRRALLTRGGASIAVSMTVIGLVRWNGGPSILGLVGLIFFTAAFATSWGPLPFLVSAEVLPKQYRGIGLTFAGLVSHAFSFAVVSAFLRLELAVGELVYALFAVIMTVVTVVTAKWLPETKGLSLEEIEALFDLKAEPLLTE